MYFRCIVKELAKMKRVAVTSTTGMASLQLGGNSTTLHHWSGILDGRHSILKLSELFRSDDRYQDAKQRILGTDLLIIDEIGMLSVKTFETVECICRYIRNNDRAFGGMQVSYSEYLKDIHVHVLEN